MQLSRRPRMIAALMVLVSMLFMQLAVAAYACPTRQLTQAAEDASMMAMADHGGAHEQMADCEGMDGDASALCHAHCQPDTQSLNKPPLPDISPFTAIILVSTVIDIGFSRQPVAVPRDDLSLRRIIGPPLSIQNCCFRI